MTNIWNTIVRERVPEILIEIFNSKDFNVSVSYLAKKVDMTFSHTGNLINQFQNAGLITTEKTGRIRSITLTKKGSEVTVKFQGIMEILKHAK